MTDWSAPRATPRKEDKSSVAGPVVVGLVTVAAGVASTLFGLAHVPVLVVGVVTLLVLCAAEGIVQAVSVKDLDPIGYMVAIGCLACLLVGIAAYHHRGARRTYAGLLGGTSAQVLNPSGSPGGEPNLFLGKFGGATTVHFACYVPVQYKDGVFNWLRVAGRDEWIPQSALVAAPGIPIPRPARCGT